MKEDREFTPGQLQTILDHITNERRKGDNYVNDQITEVKKEIAEVKCKTESLQKGVSNLQSVKTDMKQVKKDVPKIKAGVEQLQKDVDTMATYWEIERDEEGNLDPDKS